jgi:hypothetical protein
MIGKSAETARCIFCGVVGVWWGCGCESAVKIREGKLARPRTVIRGGVPVIEMCEELRAAARLAGVITREYGGFVKVGNAPNHGVETGFAKHESRETAKVSESSEDSESARPLDSLIPCVVCGKPFRARRSTAKYCSAACRVRAQRG